MNHILNDAFGGDFGSYLNISHGGILDTVF
jgi:hypothetical protein